ncbi:DNA mismatch repair protein [Aphelenchoides fujianensis]|nr:DNA mismatch repair protein [Aphelenchoides fujianensis]
MPATPKSQKPASQSQSQKKLTAFFSPKPKPKEANAQRYRRAVDDEEEDEVEFLGSQSTPKRARTAAKRARVVIESEDENEEEDEEYKEEETTRTTRRKTTRTWTRASGAAGRPKPQSGKKSAPHTPSRKAANETTQSFVQSFRFDESTANLDDSEITLSTQCPPKLLKQLAKPKDGDGDTTVFEHLTYESGDPDDPDYDPRTLFVPPDFMKKRSPGHRQWWTLKAQHYDTILFFKVGKFYELYHMDAVIGCSQCDLTMMRGSHAHCGFPEHSYAFYANKLIDLGYKVARIEQTEDPKGLGELCRVTNSATKTYGIFDEKAESDALGDPSAQYLMAICERKDLKEGPSKLRYGVCFVDCSTGEFNLCEFTDDGSHSTLRTLLANNEPSTLLHERNGISSATSAVFSSLLGCTPREGLTPKKEFLTAERTLELLMAEKYLDSNVLNWPKCLQELLADPSGGLPKAREDAALCLSALGAVLWYLQQCLIDVDLITMRRFEMYVPPSLHATNMAEADPQARWKNRRMILDGCALKSLHLLPPPRAPRKKKRGAEAEAADDGETTAKFSLFNTINRTVTPGCARLCDPKELQSRQEAVRFLSSPDGKNLLEFFGNQLNKIPDLERLFQRIHTFGLKFRSIVGCTPEEVLEKHPDARANFFSPGQDLCDCLDALEKVQRLFVFFKKNVVKEVDPQMVVDCLGTDYSDMREDLEHFKAFIGDRAKVLKEGQILPDREADPDYDQALRRIAECERELEDFLAEQQRKLRSTKISFTGSGKNRYQLEIPDTLTKSLGSAYVLTSKRKGFQRYRTSELEELIDELGKAEKERDLLHGDFTRRVFEDLDQRKNKWGRILLDVANFDCLASLARYSRESSLEQCMPEFEFEAEKPVLDIQRGNHPALADGLGVLSANSSTFIPNDTRLSGEKPVLLLRFVFCGANMGGKSTLMRQTAVLAVLAQMGSFVPAKAMKLSPIDRIFCRIGANDCLAAGHSTFYVELEETSAILREATAHSLIIIDELGRGTSTHDGTAVASATLRHLADKIQCRVLFSTHYHSLCTAFQHNPRIALGHMACVVENENEEDPSMENVTFLYTLSEGAAPKSFGFYTARMAGLNPEIVRRAHEASSWVFGANKTADQLERLSLAVKEDRISNDELLAAVGVH